MGKSHPMMKRKTKIVCTLGPAVAGEEKLRQLIDAGMDLARINCSHGEPAERLAQLQLLRRVAKEAGVFLPVMFDLQGPKIRIGRLEAPIPLTVGQKLVITSGTQTGNADMLYTTYMHFSQDVRPGEAILVDDGKIHFHADEVRDGHVYCTVVVPGLLKERKGINLPNTKISAPSLSPKDLEDLKMAVEHGADFVAISFVRGAMDVVEVRQKAAEFGDHQLRFISKIERPEALKELVSIVNTSDGVMVARGDLGVEIGSHRVPMRQKEIITRANLAGKFVITATQMLDSMMELPVPTRAEASDVANAILDGTDACMLSGETASGKYPIESVEMMDKIALEAESHSVFRYETPGFSRGSVHHIPDGISVAAFQTANLMGARLLISLSNSGDSVLKLSKKHPNALIVGITIHEHIARRMNAYWGVLPILLDAIESVETMFEEVRLLILKMGLVRSGDVAILTSGYPLWESGSTNIMKLMEL